METKTNKYGIMYVVPTVIKSPYSPTATLRNVRVLEVRKFVDDSVAVVPINHTVSKERIRSQYTPHVGKKELAKSL